MLVVRLAQPRAHATPRLREADEEVEDLGQVLNADRQYRLDYQNDISSGSWVTAAVRDAYARIGADPWARRSGERGLALNYSPARLRSGSRCRRRQVHLSPWFSGSRGERPSRLEGAVGSGVHASPRGRRRAWPLSCAIWQRIR